MRPMFVILLGLLFSIPGRGQSVWKYRLRNNQPFVGLSSTLGANGSNMESLSFNATCGFYPVVDLRAGITYRHDNRNMMGHRFHLDKGSYFPAYTTHEFSSFIEYEHEWDYMIHPTLRFSLGYGRIQLAEIKEWRGELDADVKPNFFVGGLWIGGRYTVKERVNFNLQVGIRKNIYRGKVLYGMPGFYGSGFYFPLELGLDIILFKQKISGYRNSIPHLGL